eukprot:XP_014063507.1 PREDICTED: histidine ammonia-lyase-like [Salmo salar]
MLPALRINVLAKGYSGVSMETVQAMVKAFIASCLSWVCDGSLPLLPQPPACRGCVTDLSLYSPSFLPVVASCLSWVCDGSFPLLPQPPACRGCVTDLSLYSPSFLPVVASCLSWVPEKGTVGATGDLAHLTLGLMGEGRMWSPQRGWDHAKTGIGLINGTQMMSSLVAEAVERAVGVARQADIIAALSLEALRGTTNAFHSDVHAVRPHPGQIEVALRLRSLLHSDVFPSQISESHRTCDRVQDAYTLHGIPQVHGVANDTIAFVKIILSTELNSATDNPASSH